MSIVSTLRRVNAPAPAEESTAVRAAVLVAVMAAALAALGEGVGSASLRTACLLGIPAGFVLSHVARHRNGFWLKVVLAVGVVVAFAKFLAAAAGLGPGSISDVQIPLAELFLWVQVLHSLDVPARRDLMFSLVSSLVLVTVAGVLSVSLSFAPYLAVWACAAVASAVLAHHSELALLPALRPAEGRPQVATSTTRTVLAAARPVGAVLALVAVLGTAAFLVVPAAGSARSLTFPSRLPRAVSLPNQGGLSNPTLGGDDPARPSSDGRGGRRAAFGYFGFSESLDLGARGRPDDTLVMRVRASRPDFWRGQTFDRWDGRRWSLSDDRPRPVRGAAPIDVPATAYDTPVPSGPDFVQTFYLQQGGPNLIFGAYLPGQLYFPDNAVFQTDDGSLRAGVELEDGAVYTVVSHRPPITAAALRRTADGTIVPSRIAQRYLQLSAVSDRVRALAQDVTAGAATPYDKVLALERWMAAHTRYSLDVPPLPRDADAVDRFLFEDKIGFCEQIGTSLVVMLRSLGVPARLAVGYAAGDRNPFTGLYEVRARDAHSWAEVYFPGLGWQGFDPTANVPLAGDSRSSPAGAGALSYLATHLPHVPAAVVRTAAGSVMVGIGLLAARRVAGSRRRTQARRLRPWAEQYLDRLESAGAARLRPRRPGETAREYTDALRRSVLPDPRLDRVALVLDTELFSGAAVPDGDRRQAELVLREATDAWPAARAMHR